MFQFPLFFCIIFVSILESYQHGVNIVSDLHFRLKEFQECYIVIRPSYYHLYEPMEFPIQMSRYHPLEDFFVKTPKLRPIKFYRKRNFCSVEILFVNDNYIKDLTSHYIWRSDYNFSYESPYFLIIIAQRHHVFAEYRKFIGLYLQPSISQIFIWTQEPALLESTQTVRHEQIFVTKITNINLVCRFCLGEDSYPILPVTCNSNVNQSMTECRNKMETMSKETARIVKWKNSSCGPLEKAFNPREIPKVKKPTEEHVHYFQSIALCLVGLNTSTIIPVDPFPSRDPTIQFGNGQSTNIFVTEMDSFDFITCDGTNQSVSSMLTYSKPFQTFTWVGIFSTCLLSAVLLLGRNILLINDLAAENHTPCIVYLMSTFAVLIEHGTDKRQSMFLERDKLFKLFFTLWLLMGTVITTGYKGVIVSFLSVRPVPEPIWKTFEQLENFTLFTSVKKNMENRGKSCLPGARSICQYGTSDEPNEVFSDLTSALDPRSFHQIRGGEPAIIPALESKQRVYTILRNTAKIYYTANLTLFYKSISTCNKTAFGHWNSELDYFWSYFQQKEKNPKITYFKSNSKFGSRHKGWNFSPMHIVLPEQRLKMIAATGIYQFWKYWFVQRQNEQELIKGEDNPIPLSLNLNLGSIFYVYLFGALASCIMLVLERIPFTKILKFVVRIVEPFIPTKRLQFVIRQISVCCRRLYMTSKAIVNWLESERIVV